MVFGPMSKAFCCSVRPVGDVDGLDRASDCRSNRSTRSIGKTHIDAACEPVRMRLATSIESLSTSEPPMASRPARRGRCWPCRRRSGPCRRASPALRAARSCRRSSRRRGARRRGASETLVIFCRNSISFASSRPPAMRRHRKRRGSASIDACARWQAPKASLT